MKIHWYLLKLPCGNENTDGWRDQWTYDRGTDEWTGRHMMTNITPCYYRVVRYKKTYTERLSFTIIFHSLGIFSRRQTFHANLLLWRQFAWHVKAYFLEKKNISNAVYWNFYPACKAVILSAQDVAMQTKHDTFTNSVDPDEIVHHEGSHQDLLCLHFVLIFDWYLYLQQ